MMPGSASGVFSAALWKRMMLPEDTLDVTRFVISAAEMPHQSKLSSLQSVGVMLIHVEIVVPVDLDFVFCDIYS